MFLAALLFLTTSPVFSIQSTFAAPSDPTAVSSHVPSPSESGTAEKISRKEVRRIRREFTKTLDQEDDALLADQKRKAREGDASRKLRRHEWDSTENSARRKYFDDNPHGPLLRNYMKSLQGRRTTFLSQLKNEELLERGAFEAQRKALKSSQEMRLTAVEGYLNRSERPPATLLERAK